MRYNLDIEREFIEVYKKLTERERMAIFIVLRLWGVSNADIVAFKTIYDGYLTKMEEI